MMGTVHLYPVEDNPAGTCYSTACAGVAITSGDTWRPGVGVTVLGEGRFRFLLSRF